MQRRAVGEVHEAGDPHGGHVLVGLGVAAVQDRQPGGLRAEASEPGLRVLDRALGMLERGRGRQDEDLVRLGEAQQVAVERPAGLGPLAAPEQRDRTR